MPSALGHGRSTLKDVNDPERFRDGGWRSSGPEHPSAALRTKTGVGPASNEPQASCCAPRRADGPEQPSKAREMVDQRGFVPARDEPKASCGVPGDPQV